MKGNIDRIIGEAKYILETTKKEVNEVKYVWECAEVSKEAYSEQDYKKDLIIAYGRGVGRAAKVIIPIAVLADLSFAFLFKSNHILKNRAAARIGIFWSERTVRQVS